MGFEMFSEAHVASLLVAAVTFVGIILLRQKLSAPRNNLRLRYALAALLLGCEVSLQLSYLIEDSWTVGSLPFQLCSITLIVSAVMLITRHKGLYDIVFFLGSLGALQALLTPNLDETFPHFRYFHFFIAHIGIIAAGLYVISVERYRPTFRSMLSALLWLHVLAIPAAVVNIWSGSTNFMFLARKPSTASMLDLLGPWPWYLLQLELIAFGLCLLLLGAVKMIDYMRRFSQ